MVKKRLFPGFVLLIFVLATLACSLPFGLGQTSTPTPTAPPPTSTPAGCVLPDLVGKDGKAAESAISALGLRILRTAAFSSSVPEGAVISQKPAANTLLNPCQGEVALEVSLGPSALGASPTPAASTTPAAAASPTTGAFSRATATAGPASTAAPTSRPAATSTPAAPQLKDSGNYDLLYSDSFPLRDSYGLLKGPWKKVAAGAGSSVVSENGILNVTGQFEFYGGGGYQNKIRLLMDANLSASLKDFSVFVNYQDNQNTLRMGCAGLDSKLICDWFQVKAGVEKKLTAASFELCTGGCIVQIELDQGNIGVYANNFQKNTLTDTTYATGQIGLRVDAPAAAKFAIDRVVVYEIPRGATSRAVFREDFGGDFNLDPFNGEYLNVTVTQGEGFLRMKATANKAGNFRKTPNDAINLPSQFKLTTSARIISAPKNAVIGVAFQRMENGSFYFVSLSSQGVLAVDANIEGKWDSIVAGAAAPGFRAGESNTIVIQGDGSQYSVTVNGKAAARFEDDRLSGGTFSLGLELANAGEQITVEFYQLEVRR